MQRRTVVAVAGLGAGVALLVLALTAGPAASSRSTVAGSAKRGGTLRLNLSTTDFQFIDPALAYDVTSWQLEYATALKLLNWKESKAQLFPEVARAFPRVGRGGRVHTFACARACG